MRLPLRGLRCFDAEKWKSFIKTLLWPQHLLNSTSHKNPNSRFARFLTRNQSLIKFIMVVLIQSQTYPINPPGAKPILNVEQIWEALTIKSRKPELFIKPISSAKILEEDENSLVREVYFKEGMGPPAGKAVEQILFKKPWKVWLAHFFLFRRTSSSLVLNGV